MPPPRSPSLLASPGSLGHAASPRPELRRCCSQDTHLPPARRTGRQTASRGTKRGRLALEKSRLLGMQVLTPSLGAGTTCRRGRRHHPCTAPQCHEPAEQLAAGTRNGFKASAGKFREGKYFETGYMKAPPPTGPELYVSRSTPGGSMGCQPSPCIPSLTPSPPSSQLVGGQALPRDPQQSPFALPLTRPCVETAGKQHDPVKATVKLNQKSQIKYLTSK